MTFNEMYELTPRSFFNAVNGNRKKEDAFSKERWIMTRELMFAVMSPYLEKGIEKQDILPFAWEQKQLQQLTAQKAAQMLIDIEQVNDFWDRQDAKKIKTDSGVEQW